MTYVFFTVDGDLLFTLSVHDHLLFRIHDALYFGNGESRGIAALDGRRAGDCLDVLESAHTKLAGASPGPSSTVSTKRSTQVLESFHLAAEKLAEILQHACRFPDAILKVHPPAHHVVS
ncbi:hypothetical protein KW797_03975 [Candidatus Parcubacteria bacterium]|nr:hypothetical protein [Candidatus Parcubacteria bacterium]